MGKCKLKASQSEFQQLWPGVQRCMDCGFAMATDEVVENKTVYKDESTLHSTFHGKYNTVRSQYGEKHVLSYRELLRLSELVPQRLCNLKKCDFTYFFNDFDLILSSIEKNMGEIDEWFKMVKFDEENLPMYEKADLYSIDFVKSKVNSNLLRWHEGKSDRLDIFRDIFDDYNKLIQSLLYIRSSRENSVDSLYALIPEPKFSFELESIDKSVYENCVNALNQRLEVESVLDMFFNLEFSKSLRLWDMCKPHPKFSDYKTLLWNTEKFQKYIRKYIPENVVEYYTKENYANRELVDFRFDEAPFYFGKVKEKVYPINFDAEVKDFSYMDKLTDADEDDTPIDSSDITKEYKTTVQAMKILGRKLGQIRVV